MVKLNAGRGMRSRRLAHGDGVSRDPVAGVSVKVARNATEV